MKHIHIFTSRSEEFVFDADYVSERSDNFLEVSTKTWTGTVSYNTGSLWWKTRTTRDTYDYKTIAMFKTKDVIRVEIKDCCPHCGDCSCEP